MTAPVYANGIQVKVYVYDFQYLSHYWSSGVIVECLGRDWSPPWDKHNHPQDQDVYVVEYWDHYHHRSTGRFGCSKIKVEFPPCPKEFTLERY